MTMIDLTAKPFYLNREQIDWVEATLSSLTLEEKIGQLFMPIGYSGDPDYLDNCLLRYHIGGIMYRNGDGAEMQATHRYLQEHSKIPLMIGSNLEYGGNGAAVEGTFFARPMQIGATQNPEHAYRLGKVSSREGAAVGVNWAFAPMVDIDLNWRNPITNNRTYGSNPDFILQCGLNYMKATNEEHMAVSVKHFPGDGWDEVDQHILTSVNGLSTEEWDASYGKIYQGMIDAGTPAVMVAHIAQPAYQAALGGDTNKLIPATLSPELLQGLLRGRLGFNGVIITDSTCMVGFSCAMERSKAVPYAIAAGCDIFLFNKVLDEDFQFMLDGIKSGILTEERLDEAVTRILALKAWVGIWNKPKDQRVPAPEALNIIGCQEHIQWAKECSDESITLVKDTQNLLPIRADRYPKVLLEVLGDFPSSPHVIDYVAGKLETEGFQVERYVKEDFSTANFSVENFKRNYDLVIYLGNVENTSNMVTNRLSWYTFWGNGNNVPWFVKERPTLFISVANPYHLVDVPMIQTYINCYGNSDYTLDALVEKIMGRSEFKGKSPIDPTCGKSYLAY
jgi:beta-N-acetylhexosaminidase